MVNITITSFLLSFDRIKESASCLLLCFSSRPAQVSGHNTNINKDKNQKLLLKKIKFRIILKVPAS